MPVPFPIDLAIRQAVPTTSTSRVSPTATTSQPPTSSPATATTPTAKSVAIAINGRSGASQFGGHHGSPTLNRQQHHHRAVNETVAAVDQQRRHKHKLSSYSEGSPLSNSLNGAAATGGGGAAATGGGGLTTQSRNNSLTFRPAKRQMATPNQTIAVINASGRQTASLIRYCTAVGFRVRAQLRNTHGVIATEVCTNPAVEVLVGELYTCEPAMTPPTSPPPAATPGTSTSGSTSTPSSGTTGTAGTAGTSTTTGNAPWPPPAGYTAEAADKNHAVDVSSQGPQPGIGIDHTLIRELFRGCQLAFINTTFYGDEEAIGMALADEAKRAGISHYVYSSMPDHAAYSPDWPSLPLYSSKHRVEDHVRAIGLQATFVYAGIYNNNFTSLPYPLFCMELQEADGSFVWQAPFHPDAKLPWLDCEHDFGTAVLQIFKEGPRRWGGGRRVAIAFEMLTPREACRAFARGVGRPVRYRRGPIEVKVKIPEGYRTQLDRIQRLYSVGGDDPARQPPYFGDPELEASCPAVAMELWGGSRSLEQYAREEFIIEEHANGLRWMYDDDDDATTAAANSTMVTTTTESTADGGGRDREVVTQQQPTAAEEDGDDEGGGEDDEDDDEDEGLVMSGPRRLEEKWLA